MSQFRFPPSPRSTGVRAMHGQAVPDPFDWLAPENAASREWQAGQQQAADSYFAAGAEYARVRGWLSRFLAPAHAFYAMDAGPNRFLLIDKPDCGGVALAWRPRAGGPLTLLDTHADGEVLLQFAIFPSPDGSHLAYGVKRPQGDLAHLRFIHVASGKRLDLTLPITVQPAVAWATDSQSFFYNQNQRPFASEPETASRPDGLYWRRLSDGAGDDRLVMPMSTWPEAIIVFPSVSDDGARAYVNFARLVADVSALYAIPLTNGAPAGPAQLLCPPGQAAFTYIGGAGTEDFFLTNLEAPLGRVIAFDWRAAQPAMRDVVRATDAPMALGVRDPVAERAAILNQRLYVTYLVDAAHEIVSYDLSGSRIDVVPLPHASSVAGAGGDRYGALRASDEAGKLLVSLWRFTDAPSVHEFDPSSGAMALVDTELAGPVIPSAAATRAFVERPDGAKIPLTILRAPGTKPDGPCLLYGYGAAGMPITPEFGLDIAAWLALGGVYAIAHIRGGGEYGAPWYEAAKGLCKQTTFDDFIACAEYLRGNGMCEGGLAIRGISAGGLLVGACMTQRPDLFDAVIAEIPFLDPLIIGSDPWSTMLAPDLGNPARDYDAFVAIRAYSPLQNVRTDKRYPPTFVSVADGDAPQLASAARQFVASMQSGGSLAFLHTVRGAAHGGWSREQQIDTTSRELAFLIRQLALPFPPQFEFKGQPQ